jgi:hypothetical protein
VEQGRLQQGSRGVLHAVSSSLQPLKGAVPCCAVLQFVLRRFMLCCAMPCCDVVLRRIVLCNAALFFGVVEGCCC